MLRIVKEYHYTPYAGVKTLQKQKRYLLALCGLNESASPELIRQLTVAAGNLGYGLLLSDYHQNIGEMIKALHQLDTKVDGTLIIPPQDCTQLKEYLLEHPMPFVFIEGDDQDILPGYAQFTTDWHIAGQTACERLAKEGHRNIGLLLAREQGMKAHILIHCLEQFYGRNELQFDKNYIKSVDSVHSLIQLDVSAVLCDSLEAAVCLYQYTSQQDILIPKDISAVVITDQLPTVFSPKPTSIQTDHKRLAQRAINYLVAEIEDKKTKVPETVHQIPPLLMQGDSVGASLRRRSPSLPILVVGSLNLDVVMTVPDMPEIGETMMIDSVYSLPGGKGANQALGAAKLGGEVSLIGRVGSDPAGKLLYNTLRNQGVNTKAVSIDQETETGKAYISVLHNGESFIEVYGGANHRIGKNHILNHNALFKRSAYCLVQMELPLKTVKWVVDCAYESGAKIILKPCSVNEIPDSILEKISLIVPNRTEAGRLAGAEKTVQEQGRYFLSRGCKQVIITLAEKGCYYCDSNNSIYYDAYNNGYLHPVDTSGASDAFISALAVYLSEGNPMDNAIRFANVAAGLSVTRQGVQPSLPDREAMEPLKSVYSEF